MLCDLVEGAFPRLIFDKTVVIKQLNVVEAHGLLLFRADKGEWTFQSEKNTYLGWSFQPNAFYSSNTPKLWEVTTGQRSTIFPDQIGSFVWYILTEIAFKYCYLDIFVGRDCRVHVFRLTDFEGEENEDFVRGKNEIKDHKLEKTKGRTATLLHILPYFSFRMYPNF